MQGFQLFPVPNPVAIVCARVWVVILTGNSSCSRERRTRAWMQLRLDGLHCEKLPMHRPLVPRRRGCDLCACVCVCVRICSGHWCAEVSAMPSFWCSRHVVCRRCRAMIRLAHRTRPPHPPRMQPPRLQWWMGTMWRSPCRPPYPQMPRQSLSLWTTFTICRQPSPSRFRSRIAARPSRPIGSCSERRHAAP